jgi:hypothetical protein
VVILLRIPCFGLFSRAAIALLPGPGLSPSPSIARQSRASALHDRNVVVIQTTAGHREERQSM